MQHGSLHTEPVSYTCFKGQDTFRSLLQAKTRCLPLSSFRVSGLCPCTPEIGFQIGETHLLGLFEGVRRLSSLRSGYQAHYGEQRCGVRRRKRFVDILFGDTYLKVVTFQVYLIKDLCSIGSLQDVLDAWHWKLVLHRHVVQGTVISTKA